MSEFKVGDTVECIRGSLDPKNGLSIGTIYEVLGVMISSIRVRSNDSRTQTWDSGRFKLVSNKKKPDYTSETTYFLGERPWAMVDFDQIHSELSYSKPMAIVKDNRNHGHIVVHDSVFIKAELVGIECPFSTFEFRQANLRLIANVKQWISKVKNTKNATGDKPTPITVEVLEVN
jgi:hypothetical protein